MTTFTRTQIAAIRTDIEAALKAVGEKHGIAIGTGGCTFSSTTMTMKVEACNTAKPGENVRAALQATVLDVYKNAHPNINFDAEYKHHMMTGTARIVGYNAKAHKMPFIIEDTMTGKRYKVSAQQIQAMELVG